MFIRLLTSGGALDSQTSDTQFFGFDTAVESQHACTEVATCDTESQTKELPVPIRELSTIIADIQKARRDLTGLEDELVAACLATAARTMKVRVQQHWSEKKQADRFIQGFKHHNLLDPNAVISNDEGPNFREYKREDSVVSTSDYEEKPFGTRDPVLHTAGISFEETQSVVDPPTHSIDSQIYDTIISGYMGG